MEDDTLVRDLLTLLSDKHGEELLELVFKNQNPLELLPHVAVVVNGRNINLLNGLDTSLCDGDDVFFLPLLGGG